MSFVKKILACGLLAGLSFGGGPIACQGLTKSQRAATLTSEDIQKLNKEYDEQYAKAVTSLKESTAKSKELMAPNILKALKAIQKRESFFHKKGPKGLSRKNLTAAQRIYKVSGEALSLYEAYIASAAEVNKIAPKIGADGLDMEDSVQGRKVLLELRKISSEALLKHHTLRGVEQKTDEGIARYGNLIQEYSTVFDKACQELGKIYLQESSQQTVPPSTSTQQPYRGPVKVYSSGFGR